VFATSGIYPRSFVIQIFHNDQPSHGDETLQKRDFKFHIVNFSFICNNIPAASAYGVYISQLVEIAKLSLFSERTLSIYRNVKLKDRASCFSFFFRSLCMKSAS
jgi:hypothetical protein